MPLSVTCVHPFVRTSRFRPFCSFVRLQTGEIKALAGVDFLTISPNLLEELKKDNSPVPKKLDSNNAAQGQPIPKVTYIDNEA